MPRMVSVHQPNFMPWLKLLDKILASDVYVAYDTAQFTRTEYHSRQRMKHDSGPIWLSVPLRKPGMVPIRDVRIDNRQPFRDKQLRRITYAYGKTPYFDEVYPMIERVYQRDQQWLVDLNLDLIDEIRGYLGSKVRVLRASELPHDGDRTERLVGLIRAAGGDVHLTSTVGSDNDYLDLAAFRAAGIEVRVQQFDHPVYRQPHGRFVPHLAAVDMLFACGRDTARILADRRKFVDAADLRPVARATSVERSR